ncbi:MarR family winged helix-turn-helix transcriptional regulator [Jiangella sp. DSM 45060]|uniref:MarR family winged helix-turn-helix transcriptional regulator n=1 Tax=Jiangella sp. DSM 45060 TaxID=1798224 RepID=UPI00087C2943|nr:MarR family transcriptional regulator [Jiangella sp. DSM 45060]SDS82077.1 DNA-binding transcriptional regulator, MarR family [Jiangella sp. DSM 45060]
MPASELELATALEAFLQRLACTKADSDLRSMVELDLSISQFRCLILLGQHAGALPINELADRLDLTLATAGRNVDRLVAHGLVERREDPQDRRVRLVSLSGAGQAIMTEIDDARHNAVRAFARSLDPADRDRLAAALAPIVEPSAPSRLEEQLS